MLKRLKILLSIVLQLTGQLVVRETKKRKDVKQEHPRPSIDIEHETEVSKIKSVFLSEYEQWVQNEEECHLYNSGVSWYP